MLVGLLGGGGLMGSLWGELRPVSGCLNAWKAVLGGGRGPGAAVAADPRKSPEARVWASCCC